MPQCQFRVFCCFCVSEKLHRKYSRNWTKQNLKSLITWHKDGVQRRAGDGPGAGHTWWWREPPLGHTTRGCDRLVHLLTSPFPLFNPSNEKTQGPKLFSKKHTASRRCRRREIGRARSSSRHPTGEGNHHRRPSSLPCLPPKWCVSSLPWTTGP
jgi:hypothetical protein